MRRRRMNIIAAKSDDPERKEMIVPGSGTAIVVDASKLLIDPVKPGLPARFSKLSPVVPVAADAIAITPNDIIAKPSLLTIIYYSVVTLPC